SPTHPKIQRESGLPAGLGLPGDDFRRYHIPAPSYLQGAGQRLIERKGRAAAARHDKPAASFRGCLDLATLLRGLSSEP
ncbi:hypothetical protein, partial [Teichococcus coralli]|uniref:hypothetical protein n=1 Tax=Teichococcus coralli TaxID=2545983 RepID=UPI001F43D394